MSRTILSFAAVAVAMLTAGAAAYDLEQHLWRERLLFLIAPDASDPVLEAQNQGIERCRHGITDRDLRVFRLYLTDGESPEGALGEDEIRDLRRRLETRPGDRVLILVGKDGGIKRRAGLDIDLREIFAQIDGMPMRRQEMRGKGVAPDCAELP